MLGWDARYVAGSPDGASVPDELFIRLPEHDTTLGPTWAVEELEKVVWAREMAQEREVAVLAVAATGLGAASL